MLNLFIIFSDDEEELEKMGEEIWLSCPLDLTVEELQYIENVKSKTNYRKRDTTDDSHIKKQNKKQKKLKPDLTFDSYTKTDQPDGEDLSFGVSDTTEETNSSISKPVTSPIITKSGLNGTQELDSLKHDVSLILSNQKDMTVQLQHLNDDMQAISSSLRALQEKGTTYQEHTNQKYEQPLDILKAKLSTPRSVTDTMTNMRYPDVLSVMSQPPPHTNPENANSDLLVSQTISMEHTANQDVFLSQCPPHQHTFDLSVLQPPSHADLQNAAEFSLSHTVNPAVNPDGNDKPVPKIPTHSNNKSPNDLMGQPQDTADFLVSQSITLAANNPKAPAVFARSPTHSNLISTASRLMPQPLAYTNSNIQMTHGNSPVTNAANFAIYRPPSQVLNSLKPTELSYEELWKMEESRGKKSTEAYLAVMILERLTTVNQRVGRSVCGEREKESLDKGIVEKTKRYFEIIHPNVPWSKAVTSINNRLKKCTTQVKK